MNKVTAICYLCGNHFTVGQNGISVGDKESHVDVCDHCAQVARGLDNQYAFVKPVVIERLMAGLKQQ